MLMHAAVAGGIEQIIRNVMLPRRMLTYAMCILTYVYSDADVVGGIERIIRNFTRIHSTNPKGF